MCRTVGSVAAASAAAAAASAAATAAAAANAPPISDGARCSTNAFQVAIGAVQRKLGRSLRRRRGWHND